METFLVCLFLVCLIAILPKKKFKKSGYETASWDSFSEIEMGIGIYGEFLTYSILEDLGDDSKLLTNVYLPKVDGSTIEIDIIMIAPTGIYVFESKNYGGWIFGDEHSKYWMQMFPNQQKYQFYNPIWQNKRHISVLKEHLGLDDELFRSYVVFSERCTLKKMIVHSPKVKVMNRDELACEIVEDMAQLPELLSLWEIDQIYNELANYSFADDATKQAHIDAIRGRN